MERETGKRRLESRDKGREREGFREGRSREASMKRKGERKRYTGEKGKAKEIK